jgi:hypothetical protein
MSELDDNATVASCDVCVAMDGDHRMKPGVIWCQRCGAYICQDCLPKTMRRFLAMLKRRLSRSA